MKKAPGPPRALYPTALVHARQILPQCKDKENSRCKLFPRTEAETKVSEDLLEARELRYVWWSWVLLCG